MRIDLRDSQRRLIGRIQVEPAQPQSEIVDQQTGRAHRLNWSDALDASERLVRCPACSCRDLFRRRDFPQKLGMGLVVVAIMGSLVFFALNNVIGAFAVLALAVVADFLIYQFTRQCLVCYRCRSEFRECQIDKELHEPWDLAIGEKYRPIRMDTAAVNGPAEPTNDASGAPAPDHGSTTTGSPS